MTVLERMIAAGFDPAKAVEVHGNGSCEVSEVEVRMMKCRPREYMRGILVVGEGCHPYTDGSIRPAPGWFKDDSVMMIFKLDETSFEFKEYPIRI